LTSTSRSGIRISSRWWLLLTLLTAGVVGLWWMVGRTPSTSSLSSSASSQGSSTAYRPGWRERVRASSRAQGATSPDVVAATGDNGDPDALPPELEERLLADSHVVSVPPPGYSPPPQAEMTPALAAELQRAVSVWTAQAQQQLDRCVGRPRSARQPVQLSVMFAPPTGAPAPPAADAAPGSAPPPSLAPAYVAVRPDDLRRLWRDTDPDALQSCLDQLRVQLLTLTTAHIATGLAPPSSQQSVQVQL
jgi:hypothetical protein